MQKFQRVSKFFKWIFILACFVLPVLMIIFWIQAPTPTTMASQGIIINYIPKSIIILHKLSAKTKILGFLISIIPLTVNLLTLYFLIRLFNLYETCKIFSLKNVQYIKYIGFTLFIGQLIHPVYEAMLSVALTWGNPPHERMINISFSGANIGIILGALLVMLISWIMQEGYKLKEEQKYII